MIRVVTDSVADLPPGLAEAEGIEVVPLYVTLNGRTYRDGVELTPEAFFRQMRTTDGLPSTAQPTPADFISAFERLASRGATGIVVLTLSSELSGTFQSAVQAAQQWTERAVEVIDSRTGVMAQGFAALAAARAARAAATLDEVLAEAHRVLARAKVLAAVPTLEYLRRGGRIGKAAAWAGTLLQMKPVLTLEEGIVVPVTRQRTWRRALEFVTERVAVELEKMEGHLAVMHGDALEEGRHLIETLAERVQPQEAILTDLSPVIGTYVGPGGMAVAYY